MFLSFMKIQGESTKRDPHGSYRSNEVEAKISPNQSFSS